MTLQKGDTVLIISPAGRVLDENIDNAILTLENWGLKVELSASAKKEHHNFSGTKDERQSDLQWALDHPSAKAIFASRGGYGAIQLLDGINWNNFLKSPKLLIGYSDICNLHAQINKASTPSLHALMPNSFPPLGKQNASLTTLKSALFDENYTVEWNNMIGGKDQEIEGEIAGGNLSILYSLQGTKYAPNYTDKILFIEDLCEYKYHIDRMMHNLKYSGVLQEVKAIIVGDFTDIKDNDKPFGKTVEEIILDAASGCNTSVLFGLQTGHDTPTIALPFGRKAKLKVMNNTCTLRF